MRITSILTVLMALTLLPSAGLAARVEKLHAAVVKVHGTVMVERAKNKKFEALQTKEIVERGDVVTVYEKSWVILKSPKGDILGLDGLTHVTFDELYKGGSDRQIRLNLHKGRLYIKAKKSGSRQSFFEIAAGSVLASLQKVRTLIVYDPKKASLEVQYYVGKIKVIDSAGEQTFPFPECKRIWENGKLTQEDPLPLKEEEIYWFKEFFKGIIPAVR